MKLDSQQGVDRSQQCVDRCHAVVFTEAISEVVALGRGAPGLTGADYPSNLWTVMREYANKQSFKNGLYSYAYSNIVLLSFLSYENVYLHRLYLLNYFIKHLYELQFFVRQEISYCIHSRGQNTMKTYVPAISRFYTKLHFVYFYLTYVRIHVFTSICDLY